MINIFIIFLLKREHLNYYTLPSLGSCLRPVISQFVLPEINNCPLILLNSKFCEYKKYLIYLIYNLNTV